MDTIEWNRGDSFTEHFALRDADGQTPDLTGVTAQVRIPSGETCFVHDLTPAEGGFDWTLSETTMVGLPAGSHAARLVIRWPGSSPERKSFILYVGQEDC